MLVSSPHKHGVRPSAAAPGWVPDACVLVDPQRPRRLVEQDVRRFQAPGDVAYEVGPRRLGQAVALVVHELPHARIARTHGPALPRQRADETVDLRDRPASTPPAEDLPLELRNLRRPDD